MSPALYLVRHAQSANNAQSEQNRVPDPPITPIGETQAQRLGDALERLKPSRLIVSPFLRSIQTALPTAHRTGLRPYIHREIYEQGGCYRGHAVGDRHPMPGMNRSELQTLCPDWEIDDRIGLVGWNELKYYEDIEQARLRAVQVARWLVESKWSTGERIAMIIHADFKLRMLEALLDRDDLENHFGEVVNTSITKVTRSGSRWRLDFWNAHQHLEDELITT